MTLRGVQHSGLHEVGDLVLRALCGEDPDSTAQVNRSVVTFTKEWSYQRSSYLEFWDELFRTCAADIGLFSIEGLPEGLALQRRSFFRYVSELFATFSGLRARALRIVATEASLQMITSLVHASKVDAGTRDLKQRQLDAESRKVRPNTSMIKSLKEAILLTQTRIREFELIIRQVFEKIFTHRFRDVDPTIRAACIKALGRWMHDHPLLFLSDYFLKYLGWSLNDKDSSVRLAALSSLCILYENSSENLAVMDTFNSRFIPRVCEMVGDTESGVVVKAVEALKLLYMASILPRQDIEPLLTLLLDEEEQIRAAVAELIPILTPFEQSTIRDGEKAKIGTTNLRTRSQHHQHSSYTKLLFVIQTVKSLNGGSRARTACVVDALWDSLYEIFTDWNLICNMLLSEMDKIETHEAVRGKTLETIEAVILSNVLVCSVRRAVGENLINDAINRIHPIYQTKSRQVTNHQRHAYRSQKDCFTQIYANHLLNLLQKWKSDEAVVAPLIEVAQYLKLEHFTMRRSEADYGHVLQCIGDVFLLHSSRRVADACSDTLFRAVTERSSLICTFGTQTCNLLLKQALDVLQDIHVSNAAGDGALEKLIRSRKDANQVFAGLVLRNRMMLLRLNSLLTCLPLDEICNTTELSNELLERLIAIISGTSLGSPAGAKLEIALLSIRAASLILVHQMVSFVESDATEVASLRKHVALRDAFLEAVTSFLNNPQRTGSTTILSKAIVSTFTAIIVYYQHVSVMQSNCHTNPEKEAMLISLKCLPSDGMMQTIWEACNHIFDSPLEDSHSDIIEDERTCGEDTAQVGYNLAMCDAALSDDAHIPAELLANRGHSGHWVDCAIDALMTDLRLLGPQASGNTIITSLASAFEEIGIEKHQAGVELEEAFRELASRIADLFTVGSQRDRMIVRCVIEEGLKFVVPDSSPNPARLRFLPVGLGCFISKLASVDAKKLMEPLNGVIAVVDREDKDMYTPLFDFVKLVAGRTRGVGSVC